MWLENVYSRPQNWGLGQCDPLNGLQFQENLHGDVPQSSRPHHHIKFDALKIQHGGQLRSGRYKKAISLKSLGPILAEF